MTTFGQVIAAKRRELYMSQRDLSGQIKNDEGKPISGAYLNDIEHDRRSPSRVLVKQFAAVLKLDEGYLAYLAGRFPHDKELRGLSQDEFVEGMRAFRRKTGR
jgi:transcriptional regulator with XRE-family HTH domain